MSHLNEQPPGVILHNRRIDEVEEFVLPAEVLEAAEDQIEDDYWAFGQLVGHWMMNKARSRRVKELMKWYKKNGMNLEEC